MGRGRGVSFESLPEYVCACSDGATHVTLFASSGNSSPFAFHGQYTSHQGLQLNSIFGGHWGLEGDRPVWEGDGEEPGYLNAEFLSIQLKEDLAQTDTIRNTFDEKTRSRTMDTRH